MSTSPRRGLFDGIVKNEASTTSLVCNLLQFPEFRDPFLGLFVPREILAEITPEQITEQEPLPDRCRPDLMISTGRSRFFIELKTEEWTQLTDNQPEGYLGALASGDESHTGLGFLVPSRYVHLSDLKARLAKWEAPPGHRKPMCIVRTWDEVIDALSRARLQFPIGDFLSMLCARFRPPSIRFSSAEVIRMDDTEVPRLVERLFNVVSAVRAALKDSDLWKLQSLPRDDVNYGFTANDALRSVWFGVWWDAWIKFGTPLTIALYMKSPRPSADVIASFRQRHSAKLWLLPDHLVSCLETKTKPDEEGYTTELVGAARSELNAIFGPALCDSNPERPALAE